MHAASVIPRISTPSRVPSPLDRALAAGNWPVLHPLGHWLVESSTRPGLDHVIRVEPDGLTCDCEAGTFGEVDCLHRAAVRYCLQHGVRAAYAVCASCHARRVAKAGQFCVFCRPERPLCPNCHTEVVETVGEWCAGCAGMAKMTHTSTVFACSRNGRSQRLPRDGSRIVLRRSVAEHVQNPVPSPRQPRNPAAPVTIANGAHCKHCGMNVLDPMHEIYCSFA